MKQIYLDHAATAPMLPDVVDEMASVMKEVYGNPSSVHSFGRKARKLLDEARRTAAESIGAEEKEIIFTSGGTESDNLALIGTALANQTKGKHIIISEVEHHAILHAADYLQKQGFSISEVPVDHNGRVSIADVEAALTEETILVSIMAVNNEVGTIQPINEIGNLLRAHQAYFHTDAVQALGMMDLNVKNLGVDLLTVSSHKIGGPKGIGFLYSKTGINFQPLQYGGQQERRRRAGTENVAGIVGFKRSLELLQMNRMIRKEKYQGFKETLLSGLKKQDMPFFINGSQEFTVESIINISFPGTNVESVLMNFDLAGVAASSGSACTAGSVEPSHVLSAMYGFEDERTVNSIRISFGEANTLEDIEEATERIGKIIKRLIK